MKKIIILMGCLLILGLFISGKITLAEKKTEKADKKKISIIQKKVRATIIELPIRDGSEPGWSPDGKNITFSKSPVASVSAGDGPDYKGIYRANADGTNVVQLFHREDERAEMPKWSPDGKKIAFLLRKKENNIPIHLASGDIWIMDATNGGNLKQLTNIAKSVDIEDFCWSNDNSNIIYLARVGVTNPPPGTIQCYTGLFTVNVIGTPTIQRIYTEKDILIDSVTYTPFWSFLPSFDKSKLVIWLRIRLKPPYPKGRKWAEYCELWLMDIDGSKPRFLFDEYFGFGPFAWMPDGNRLLGTVAPNGELATFDLTTLTLTKLGITLQERATDLSISPDGKKIIWWEGWQDGEHLKIMTLDR